MFSVEYSQKKLYNKVINEAHRKIEKRQFLGTEFLSIPLSKFREVLYNKLINQIGERRIDYEQQ